MTDFTCPECKGSGVYQGLNTVEPCRACGAKSSEWIDQQLAKWPMAIHVSIDELRQRQFSGQPLSHEIKEQATEEKPLDEIMPAELEDIVIGQCIKVCIEYKDWPRAFMVANSHISRPLFGFPPNSFMLYSIASVPCGNNPELTGELLYRPRTESDKLLHPCNLCQDMLFIPILEN